MVFTISLPEFDSHWFSLSVASAVEAVFEL